MTASTLQDILEQVNSAMQAADVARATTLARDALAAGAVHPDLLNLRAFWFESEGRDAEAFADLQRASMLAPESIGIRYALGVAHAKAQRHREAIACFDAVIAREPNFGPAHFNKGWASEALGDLHAARDCFARAHELTPANAEPLAGMAALAVRAGDWAMVCAHAGRALAIDPTHPIAITALAAAERASGAFGKAESRLRALLTRSDLEAAQRSHAEGHLGDMLDAQGRIGEAFAMYQAGNDALRRFHAPQFEGPGIETMPMYLRWLTELFEEADRADWAAAKFDAMRDAGLPVNARVHGRIPAFGDDAAGTGARQPFRRRDVGRKRDAGGDRSRIARHARGRPAPGALQRSGIAAASQDVLGACPRTRHRRRRVACSSTSSRSIR